MSGTTLARHEAAALSLLQFADGVVWWFRLDCILSSDVVVPNG